MSKLKAKYHKIVILLKADLNFPIFLIYFNVLITYDGSIT